MPKLSEILAQARAGWEARLGLAARSASDAPPLRSLLLRGLLLVGVVMAIVGVAVEHVQHRRFLERGTRASAVAVVRTLAAALEASDGHGSLDALLALLAPAESGVAVAVLGGSPLRVLAGPSWPAEGLIGPDLEDRLQMLARLSAADAGTRVPGLPVSSYLFPAPLAARMAGPQAGARLLVQVAPLGGRAELWLHTARFVFFTIGLLGTLGLVLLRLADRYVLRSLEKLGSLVDRVASGERDASVPLEHPCRELASFARGLDAMLRSRDAAHNDLMRSEAELRLLGRISRIADRCEDSDSALAECCSHVCRFLCWPVGHVLVVDENDSDLLRSAGIWHVTCPELAGDFVERTREMTFRRGEGLPGRVLARREPVWVEDCWQEDWFLRSEAGAGQIRGAVGFPIFVAGQVIAVLELFDIEPREPEVRPIALMHNIGLTFGQVLQRRENHELLVRRNLDLVDAMQVAVSATHSKSAFLANMSHEIRTPLTAIMGYADLLLEAETAEEREDYISTIRRNGDLLLQLICDILDVSKIEAGRLAVERIDCCPADIVCSVIEMLAPQAREKGVELTARVEGSLPSMVRTDPTRLQQILLNLVGNAVKFTRHGAVEVRIGLVTAPDDPSPRLGITVEDSGIGIGPEQLARLFEPFAQADSSTTRRFGGTGLGLSISKSLVELLGGEMHVTSREGVGSVFSFTLRTGPLADVPRVSELVASGMHRRAEAPRGKAVRIDDARVLLAEDGPDNRRLVVRLIERAGGKIEVVENGALAVDVASAAAANGQPFDVILMDMHMPVMDGYAATRELRQQGYRGRILALTANAMKGDREKCLAAGCDGFLSKPIDRNRLIESIAEDPERA